MDTLWTSEYEKNSSMKGLNTLKLPTLHQKTSVQHNRASDHR